MVPARTGAGAAEVFRAMAAAKTVPEAAELLELAETLETTAV
jgi:hypothetical protein